jgi:hypothetical protein
MTRVAQNLLGVSFRVDIAARRRGLQIAEMASLIGHLRYSSERTKIPKEGPIANVRRRDPRLLARFDGKAQQLCITSGT